MSIKLITTIGPNNELVPETYKSWKLPENEKRIYNIIRKDNRYLLIDYDTLIKTPDKYSGSRLYIYSDKELSNYLDVIEYNNKEDIIKRFQDSEESLWIIGNTSKIYKDFIESAITIDITQIDEKILNPSGYFPKINEYEWDISNEEINEKENSFHTTYKRKERKR